MMVLSPWNDWWRSSKDWLERFPEDLLRPSKRWSLAISDTCWVLLGHMVPWHVWKIYENLLQIHLEPPDLDFGDLSMNHRTIGGTNAVVMIRVSPGPAPQWLAAGWRSRHPSAWAWRKRARLQECTRNTPGTAEWCLGLWNWDHDPMTQSPLQICDCQA
jgi:hypothetical protein